MEKIYEMKLKCWKKTKDDKLRKVFINKKTKRVVSVEDEGIQHLKKRHVFLSGKENHYVDKVKYFNKKPQALKFANKYMKKHDKC